MCPVPLSTELPLPDHFDPARVGQVWRVPYGERAAQARAWARTHRLTPAAQDRFRIALIAIDVQNTFCLPDFELFVAGKSGTGAVDDNQRLCEFIYRNLGRITEITATLDTHLAMQIFHPLFLLDNEGHHPDPYTPISADDVASGKWRVNPEAMTNLGLDPDYSQRYLEHYTKRLEDSGKYALTIWPYHAMLGGIGHALVPAVEEALFFHTIARNAQVDFLTKGDRPLTEHYSAVGPEILEDQEGRPIGERSSALARKAQDFNAVVIAGQAKSHCVAWTIADLLIDLEASDPGLVNKVYLLEDCTSPVVVPGADFSAAADSAFERFAEAGMHRVHSSHPMEKWPGLRTHSPA